MDGFSEKVDDTIWMVSSFNEAKWVDDWFCVKVCVIKGGEENSKSPFFNGKDHNSWVGENEFDQNILENESYKI